MACYVGVDLGTSSIKMIAARSDGTILATTTSPFSIISEQSHYSEENPQDWLQAFDEAFSQLLLEAPELACDLEAISFSGQMHSLVLLDETGYPLRNAILWNDTRTVAEVEFLKAQYAEHLLQVEKNIALEGFTLPKILWVKRNEPALFERTWKFMMPKDYLVYYLTEQVFTDRSDASGTILYDVKRHAWDEELLRELEIKPEQCPEVVESVAVVGKLKPALQEKFGMEREVRIVIGGADNACGALGNISHPETQGLISVGTSGVVLAYSRPAGEVTGKYHYFNSAISGWDYKMGVTLSAGYSLEWFRKVFAPNEDFEELTGELAQVPIGANGVRFNPYLFGERSPYFNPYLSASITGIRANHRRQDIVRALLEGVTFSLKNVYDQMELGEAIQTFRITGGVVKNPLWLQMFADVFEMRMEVLALDEGPAFGALICAIQGIEGGESAEILRKFNPLRKTFNPIAGNVERYREAYQGFLEQSEMQNRISKKME
ncbi:xylulokinase [Listeria kieliensis]|nr:xylulokinase [Listeria kieliensis]